MLCYTMQKKIVFVAAGESVVLIESSIFAEELVVMESY